MRAVHTRLQDHLNESGTTVCYLLKITATNGTTFGVTSLDQDVAYDDGTGAGELIYSAPIGLDQSSLATSSNLDVDNSEAIMLLADSGPMTARNIEAGVLDYAKFIAYRINWRDPTSTRQYILASGTTGAVKQKDGLSGVIELRGLPQKLKQTYSELYSITCRAIFGSQPFEETLPCNFNATSLWDTGDVASVGSETDRVFVAAIAPSATGPNGALSFVPGLLEWLTGDNVGHFSEIETNTGTAITLRFPTPFPIQVADTYTARPDCAKRFVEDCVGQYDNFINFRGEYLIPLADEAGQFTPGAFIGIDLGIYRDLGIDVNLP